MEPVDNDLTLLLRLMETEITKSRLLEQQVHALSSQLNLANYLADGEMQTTKELRQRPAMACLEDWQRCHNVGLNLLKQILNHYSLVRQLRLTRQEFLTLRRDVNDPRLNLRCCSPEANTVDKAVEAEVLDHVFRGAALSTVAAQQMFQQLLDFLAVVRRDTAQSESVGTMLDELERRQFPLQRYCFECDAAALLYQTEGGSCLTFCSEPCQDAYYNK